MEPENSADDEAAVVCCGGQRARSVLALVRGFLADHGFSLTVGALDSELASRRAEAAVAAAAGVGGGSGDDELFIPARRFVAKPAHVPDVPAGELLRVLDEHEHLSAAASRPAKAVLPGVEVLDQPGDGEFCTTSAAVLDMLHDANVLSAVLREDGQLFTTSSDKSVKRTLLTNLPDNPTVEEMVDLPNFHAAPIISLAIRPGFPDQMLTGCLGGKVKVWDAATEEELFAGEPHQKYVVRVVWSSDGNHFFSASYDHTGRLYEADAGNGFRLTKEFYFKGAVESAMFAPHAPCLAVSVRDDHRIHIIDAAAGGTETFININALGDDHVSFSVLELSYSPCGTFLLASTDSDRLILFHAAGKEQLRTFYGADNDRFSSPRHCWHPSGKYIYSSSQSHAIVVWDVATQEVVGNLKGHTATIRGLRHSDTFGLLVSCGFDKTCRLWKL